MITLSIFGYLLLNVGSKIPKYPPFHYNDRSLFYEVTISVVLRSPALLNFECCCFLLLSDFSFLHFSFERKLFKVATYYLDH